MVTVGYCNCPNLYLILLHHGSYWWHASLVRHGRINPRVGLSKNGGNTQNCSVNRGIDDKLPKKHWILCGSSWICQTEPACPPYFKSHGWPRPFISFFLGLGLRNSACFLPSNAFNTTPCEKTKTLNSLPCFCALIYQIYHLPWT